MKITVKEFKEILSKFNDDDYVIKSIDSEGNSFDYIDIPEDGVFYDGDVYIKKLTPELIEQGFCEDDLCNDVDAENVIIIY